VGGKGGDPQQCTTTPRGLISPAVNGTTLTLSLRGFGSPKAYVREVNELGTEVGAFTEPSDFTLRINDRIPVGRPETGPLADAPPIGADLQNLWYET
jgi:hypothetical protein